MERLIENHTTWNFSKKTLKKWVRDPKIGQNWNKE